MLKCLDKNWKILFFYVIKISSLATLQFYNFLTKNERKCHNNENIFLTFQKQTKKIEKILSFKNFF